jgi:hypothetical protein
MRHEWQCSTCGQIFTRKWNCQRHVKDSHAGDGQVVPASVYPSSRGKGRKPNGGKRHRDGYFFYDYRALAHTGGAFAGMGNYYYGQGSPAAAGPYRKNRQTWLEKWDVRLEQARRITENMEKVFKGPSPQAVASAAPRGIPTEIIVGRACEKCMSVSYVPLPDANTGSYDINHDDVCKKRDKPVEEEEDSQRGSVNIREKISPETLKQMVDSWLMGYQKYLAAYRLPLEQLRALPVSGELKCYEIDAAKLKNNSNSKEEEEKEGERMVNNEPRPHTNNYIVRAIRSWGQSPGGSVSDGYTSDTTEDVFYGWVPLTEDEVFDFLTKARATAMVCNVHSRDGNGGEDSQQQNGYWYYLKIIPPHEIAAREHREQNAMTKSMMKRLVDNMNAEMMSELKEEEEEDAIYNNAEPREGDKENHSSSDLRDEPTIAAGRDRLRAGPTRERRNKQAKKQEHEQKQQPQRQEELDNNNGLPSRSKEKDEILKISEIRVPQYFEPVLGSNHDSAYPSSDTRYCRYAIQDLVDGPTDKQSWYLGLEIDGGVTRVWGFPGESTQMMHPKSRELQRQLGVGGVNDHPDDENRQQVCYGIEYPGRTMGSFLFGLPPLEDIELDLKGNEDSQGNNIHHFSLPGKKGLQIVRENARCKIESITPDEIIFTINERDEFPWKYFGRTKLFAGRYRLFYPEQDSGGGCSTRPIKDSKKLWQLSRVA